MPLQFKRDGWNDRIYNSVPPVDPASVVIFGGYLGETTAAWLARLPGAKIEVFEPVQTYASSIESRFTGEKVQVHPYGVAERREARNFYALGDATYAEGLPRNGLRVRAESSVSVNFISISELVDLLPRNIDVLEVNIEGGEYELLKLLSNAGILGGTINMFIQFHAVGIDTADRIAIVRDELTKTHELVWKYELVWEFWRLRNATVEKSI